MAPWPVVVTGVVDGVNIVVPAVVLVVEYSVGTDPIHILKLLIYISVKSPPNCEFVPKLVFEVPLMFVEFVLASRKIPFTNNLRYPFCLDDTT